MPTTSTPARIATLAAIIFAIGLFGTVASVNVPHDASDAALLEWWQQDSNVTSGLVSMVFAFLTAVSFAVLSNHLLILAGDLSPRLAAFSRSMATAFVATLLVSAALRGVVGHLVKAQDEPLPAVDVLRYSTALNYTVLGVAVMGTFALFVISMGALVLRTGVLARWTGFIGLGCGLVVLGAVAALLGAFAVPVALLWAACTAVAVWRAPLPVEISQSAGTRAEVLT